jgi:glucosyl-dolichyl phosphate glucuronosyltransferase
MSDRSAHRNQDVLVSIIVPTRNRAMHLSDSLSSLARQDCRAALEFVVVDNASTDDTTAVMEGWRRRDERFRPLHEERLGRSQAMNAGAASARGSVLIFTDDDVVADRDWAETLRAFLAQRSADLVVAGGPILPIADDLGPWPPWLASGALVDLGALDWGPVERSLGRNEHLWGANMAVSADAFARIGPWDETVGRRGDDRGTYEDVEYQHRIRAAGGSVWFCPDARIFHRIDRLEVTPRRILSTAFSRGRNQFWKGDDLVAAERRGPGLLRSFGVWARLSVALRLGVRRDRIERARAAAFAAGRAMERALEGSEKSPANRLAQTISWMSSRAILRTIPTTNAEGPSG